ncbi:putative transcription factor C2H2 family [Helianthus annuus]|uniref:RING-type E3 ubiquitin transferase n=1 Tax=Helianthus annuus TaxID=4232 RepID=A0A251SKG2_HELAN|nr:putative transcription factor C2H2 family [Helianthus annuus]KAJ0465404.1 putative transcription factor C2H2 family [Helianthus annuus]KAJ0470223.1 putative transcription factor C2H2 family [Helianthus annuus]KAJ0487005.1 putative transcription factor C2H2 family [Helianthus annuus]KAJ0661124.1 putative transcription factor C2H2 family [Helianthus annuus]
MNGESAPLRKHLDALRSMTGPTDTGEPIDTGGHVLGLYFSFLFILFIFCYIFYICKRHMNSFSPIPTTAGVNSHFTRLPAEGLRDDVVQTFPTFVYSETDRSTSYYGSSCSICLADYVATDMVRLLPECGHLFHVECIDTWLKVHRTCPVCRNSLDFMSSVKHVFVS